MALGREFNPRSRDICTKLARFVASVVIDNDCECTDILARLLIAGHSKRSADTEIEGRTEKIGGQSKETGAVEVGREVADRHARGWI